MSGVHCYELSKRLVLCSSANVCAGSLLHSHSDEGGHNR